VPWVIAHGYFIFFIISVAEGTAINVSGGVASALGYFNIGIIIFLAILADSTADLIYYSIGYFSRKFIIEKHGKVFGLTAEKIGKIENTLNKNLKKSMGVMKLSAVTSVPGLMTIGASRIPLKRVIPISLLVATPKCLFFVLIGFYSAKTYVYLNDLINKSSYILLGLSLLLILIFILYNKVTSKIIGSNK
jgi:membrane protein DedA with SNARE-associated domain